MSKERSAAFRCQGEGERSRKRIGRGVDKVRREERDVVGRSREPRVGQIKRCEGRVPGEGGDVG